MLMGHSLGVTDSYVRFTEEQMLEDYIKIIEYVTVNQTVVLINKTLKEQQATIQKSMTDMEERHKKEMELLREENKIHFKEITTENKK